jgi:hypothetical protein
MAFAAQRMLRDRAAAGACSPAVGNPRGGPTETRVIDVPVWVRSPT